MANLLPEEIKKQIRREYLWRLSGAAVSIVILAEILVVVLAAPPLFRTYSANSAAEVERTSLAAKEISAEDKSLLAAFSNFKSELGILLPASSTPPMPSELMKVVTLARTKTVTLSSFSYFADDPKNLKLVVSGISGTREDLLAFAKRLEGNSTFSAVDLPVSNYTKKADIDFTVTLNVPTK